MASARGVICDSKGNKQREFAWGIGRKTNNKAEWLGLIKGLETAINLGIKNLMVVGDSLIVIREARNIITNKKNLSSTMHHLLISISKEFQEVNFLHILRGLNGQVDGMANKVVGLSYGSLNCDNVIYENTWIP